MPEFVECRKCGSSQINEGTLNHFADCPDHPNKIAAERLQADNAKRELSKGTSESQQPSDEFNNQYAGPSHGGTIMQPAMFTVPPVVFKGTVELKLTEEDACAAFTYYLTTVMNTPNIEVISVTRNAKKEFVVKFKGK